MIRSSSGQKPTVREPQQVFFRRVNLETKFRVAELLPYIPIWCSTEPALGSCKISTLCHLRTGNLVIVDVHYILLLSSLK